MENLLHYLPHGRQRIELTPLHLVQQPPQLRVAGDGALQMRLRPAGGDRENLSREVLTPPLLQLPLLFEMGPVLLDLAPQLGDVLAARRIGEDDRRPPR